MMKVFKNHLIHRFETTKALLIVYAVFIIAFFIMLSPSNSLLYIKERELILALMSMMETAVPFLMTLSILFILMAVKMYLDYKQGNVRWTLLTKNKKSYVIGDIIFLFICVLILYILYYALLRYSVSVRIGQFDQKVMMSYGFNDSSYFLANMDIMKLWFPKDIGAILSGIMKIILECSLCVCAVRYLLNGKKHFMDLIILVVGLIIVVKLGSLLNVYIQTLVYVGLTVFYFREAWKTWNVVERRNSDVEN